MSIDLHINLAKVKKSLPLRILFIGGKFVPVASYTFAVLGGCEFAHISASSNVKSFPLLVNSYGL